MKNKPTEHPIKVNETTINIRVTNNTALPQAVNMLGGSQDPNTISPHNLYQWDLSGNDYFGDNNIVIEVSTASNPTTTSYSVPLQGTGIQAIVYALNTLGIGFFQASGNILYVSNDYYVYGTLFVESTTFISTWKTNNTSAGSSAANQVSLPLEATGTYDFTVDWGDGNRNKITVWNQAETTHTYASAGTYTIKIVGNTLIGWRFNDTGDRLKLLSVTNWGMLRIGNSGNYFSGCQNLNLSSVADPLNLTGTTTLEYIFSGCTALSTVARMNDWNVSGITNMDRCFFQTDNFNTYIGGWNTANVTSFNGTFYAALKFNQNISAWNTANATTMQFMFRDAIVFNQPIGSWNTTNVTDMTTMLANCFLFNQPLSAWNVTSLTGAFGFMDGKSPANYQAQYLADIYNAWSAQLVQNGTQVDFGTIEYEASGQAGRDVLTGTYSWTISDGGVV